MLIEYNLIIYVLTDMSTGSSMEFDSNIKTLIDAAYDEGKDVFLKMRIPAVGKLSSDKVRTAVFLPGAFASDKSNAFSDIHGVALAESLCQDNDFIVSDIRFLNKSTFRDYLVRHRFTRIILLFTECADIGEYGYRESFFSAGEFRAELEYFCQIIAFFSPCVADITGFADYFGCEDVICAGITDHADFTCCETSDVLQKFRQTAASAGKYAFRKVLVYFNSRSEARDFASFLSAQGKAHMTIDGSLCLNEKHAVLSRFYNSDCCILIATKTFIPDSLFFSFHKVIFCGVPFSEAHLYRCTYACADRKIDVIYCESDFIRNEKIIRSFSVKTEDNRVYEQRTGRLLEIKNILKRG